MNFELVRAGWPNTVAIVALAMMPIVSVAAASSQNPVATASAAATICQPPADGAIALATLLPDTHAE